MYYFKKVNFPESFFLLNVNWEKEIFSGLKTITFDLIISLHSFTLHVHSECMCITM